MKLLQTILVKLGFNFVCSILKSKIILDLMYLLYKLVITCLQFKQYF